MTPDTFTDQSFGELCDTVRGVYTDAEHVRAVGWDAGTPAHHIEGAVIAEIHARMEAFIGERMEVADRIRAPHSPRDSGRVSHAPARGRGHRLFEETGSPSPSA